MMRIEDAIHCESHQGKYSSFDDAIAELKRREWIRWDSEPNRAPCTSWNTCGRKYEIVEYDDSSIPWKRLRSLLVLSVSSVGAIWATDFQEKWDAAAP